MITAVLFDLDGTLLDHEGPRAGPSSACSPTPTRRGSPRAGRS
ncbi:hypothetical protein ACFQY7_25815 [Actinomadura luteofluorescens]